MKRLTLPGRADWTSRVEGQGLVWHFDGGEEGWNEQAAYILEPAEVKKLCAAARELAELLNRAAKHVVQHRLWSLLGLQPNEADLILSSWERREWSLHGRFDFLFDAQGTPKLLEYNSETALSLVETAVIQKNWLADTMPGHTQCNQLEEALLSAWRESGIRQLHCAWRPRHSEVEGTVRYMTQLARRAGIQATMMTLHRIGWDSRQRQFVDHDGVPVRHCFKIYPWAWMLRETFAGRIPDSGCAFIEPLWRLMLGSKGILCVLSELFPDHPSILACHTSPEHLGATFVSKPLFGHEGHNVMIYRDGNMVEENSGDYAGEARVYQTFVESPRYDGYLPQFGVWMVRDQPVAIGIRESRKAIITGKSAFVPHAMESAQYVVQL
jgi:glutathionylspermidine synthase